MKEWLSIKEVSEIYGISDSTQYTLRQKREIPFAKVGGSIKYSKKTLDEWMKDKVKAKSSE